MNKAIESKVGLESLNVLKVAVLVDEKNARKWLNQYLGITDYRNRYSMFWKVLIFQSDFDNYT